MSNGQKKPHLKGQGVWLKKIRGARDIKQMSKILGISERAYYHYENEEREISGPVKKLIEIDQWSKINESGEDYKLHGDWPRRSLEDFCGVPKGIGFIKAVDVIADIFRTENMELIDKTVDALKSLRESGTGHADNITYMDPAVRIMNEILREENAELDADELAAVLEMLKAALEKPKSNTINLIRAFKKGDFDGGGKAERGAQANNQGKGPVE